MISVTVAHNDTTVTLEAEGELYPDLLDDLCRRAAGTLVATLIQLVSAIEEDE